MNFDWMDRLFELATTWFWLLTLATWRALPILILVTAITLAFRRKLSPSLHAMLLTIVVIRLLIPVSLGSPLSLHKPIDSWLSSESDGAVNQWWNGEVREHSYSNSYGVLPSTDAAETQWVPIQAQTQPFSSFSDAWEAMLFASLCVVIFVSTLLLIRSVVSHIRFALKLRSCPVLDDQKLIDLLLRECDSLAVGRRPVVREVASLDAPAVFGLFRHTICFPPGLIERLSERELRWVIRHELAHVRRYDIHVAIIASIAGALHWFNPVVWLIVKRLRTAMEAAADRLALQNVSPGDTVAYGELLLGFAEVREKRKNWPTLGLISIASGKDLKRRIELLVQDRKPTSLTAKILSAAVVTAIAGAGLTDARYASEQKMPAMHLVAGDSVDQHVEPMWNDAWSVQETDGPAFVESYHVASIFETMPESISGSQNSGVEKLVTWLGLPSSLKAKLHLEGMTLSAELTPRQHLLLEQRLEIWKNGEPKQIMIEARFIQTDTLTASSIDWIGSRVDGLTIKGIGPAIAARIDQPKLDQLIKTVSSDPRGNIMFAPRVVLFDGQMGVIADEVKRPFVTGVNPKADGRIQPIVSIANEGLTFVLTPKSSEDDSITLDFEVKVSSVGKVSYANLPIKSATEVTPQLTVQVPAIEQYEVSSSAKLAAGESIVVAIPRVFDNAPGADAETTIIVALTPRVVEQEQRVESESAK